MTFEKYRTKKITNLYVTEIDDIIKVRVSRRKSSIDTRATRVFLWKTIYAGFAKNPIIKTLTLTDWRKYRLIYLGRKKAKTLFPGKTRRRL